MNDIISMVWIIFLNDIMLSYVDFFFLFFILYVFHSIAIFHSYLLIFYTILHTFFCLYQLYLYSILWTKFSVYFDFENLFVMINIWVVFKALETKKSIVLNLLSVSNTILSCFFLFLLVIDLYFLILAVNAQIFSCTAKN